MSEVTIRILGSESEAELIEFNKLCFPKDFWKEEDWHELLSDPRAVYYALLDGDTLIGNVFIYNWQGEHDYVKIMNLSVRPDHRGSAQGRTGGSDHFIVQNSRTGLRSILRTLHAGVQDVSCRGS